MKKWSAAVDLQRKESLEEREVVTQAPNAPAPEFAWMQGQKEHMHNPYAEPDDDNDDEDDYPSLANSGPFSQQLHASQDYGGQHTFPGQNGFSMNRNASSTSLRSRSTTGESAQSLAGIARQPPPRFPMQPQPALSLQTHVPQTVPSPSHRGGPGFQDSYFSPVNESPASISSSRASQNSMYPFPRQGTPQGTWEDQNRHTAPAMGHRVTSREGQQSISNANCRNPQRPSLPVMSSQGGNAQRSRSYSTPDINAQISS